MPLVNRECVLFPLCYSAPLFTRPNITHPLFVALQDIVDNKKYTIESFADYKFNDDAQLLIQVLYEGHDDSKWETVPYLRKELTVAAYEELMKPLRATMPPQLRMCV